MWEALKGNKLKGYRFKPQHPISRFIVDFYSHKAKLVIEIDGNIHEIEQIRERDEGRTFELENLGLTVIRFTNKEVLNSIDKVLKSVSS